jgi:hypothetical protein
MKFTSPARHAHPAVMDQITTHVASRDVIASSLLSPAVHQKESNELDTLLHNRSRTFFTGKAIRRTQRGTGAAVFSPSLNLAAL